MGKFCYEANDKRGNLVRGELQADDLADAERKLREQALEPVNVVAAGLEDPAIERGDRLTTRDAEQLVVQVAELSMAQVPLAAGLRAAAASAASHRLARALRSVAGDVEQGLSLEAVVEKRGNMLPLYVRGLILSATRTGRLGPALDELVEHQRTMREIALGVIGAIAYPLIVLALTFALLSFLPIFVVPEFKKMFEEFELELPRATELLIKASDLLQMLASQTGLWVLLGIVLLVGVFLMIPGLSGVVRGRRILVTIPIIGPLWHWSGAAEFSQMLAILLDEGIGLPEALRLTADGLNDPDLSGLCGELSRGVREGGAFSELLASTSRLPSSIIPLVRWGEKTGDLPEALRTASNMMLGRIRMRAMLLRSISPPVVFLLVFLSIGSMIVSLFMPLVSLISSLS